MKARWRKIRRRCGATGSGAVERNELEGAEDRVADDLRERQVEHPAGDGDVETLDQRLLGTAGRGDVEVGEDGLAFGGDVELTRAGAWSPNRRRAG